MLRYIDAALVPAENDTPHKFVHISKDSDEGFSRLSPFSECDGIIVPGSWGPVKAPSVWSGFQYSKRSKNGIHTSEALANPRKIYIGVGGKLIKNDTGKVIGIDSTDELHVYKNKMLNRRQAILAILFPMYERFLMSHRLKEMDELATLVAATHPHDVLLYDNRSATPDLCNPVKPFSHAFIICDVYHRVYLPAKLKALEATNVETDKVPS